METYVSYVSSVRSRSTVRRIRPIAHTVAFETEMAAALPYIYFVVGYS